MACHHHHHHQHDDHDHSHDDIPVLQSDLYQQVNFDAILTFNESRPESGSQIVRKTWLQRLDLEPQLESDVDEQLLMHIPFVSQVKLYSLIIKAAPSPSAPKTLKLFRNRSELDFNTAATLSPTQKLTIPQSSEVIEIPLNRAHWNATTMITLFVEDNWSDGEEDVTQLSYLAFKGDFLKLIREPVTFLYEAAANPNDHVTIQGTVDTGSHTAYGQ